MLMGSVTQRMATEAAARLDSTLSDILWGAQTKLPPRVVRSLYVPVGTGYEIPGTMFTDGLSRMVLHVSQEFDEEAWING